MIAQDKIYEIMKERCMKQAAVATAAGYSPREFNDLLKGRRKFKAADVVPICRALDITPNFLFGYDGSQQKPRQAAQDAQGA